MYDVQVAQRISILVVDDDPIVLALLVEILSSKGYLVKTASTAFQARSSLERWIPDIILLDRGLPDVEGVEFIKEIRAKQQCSTLPVLFITARKATKDKVEGLRSGADDYLAKPFAQEELLARVEVLLRRSQLPPEPPKLFQAHGLMVDMVSHKVTLGDRELKLSATCFELLVAFMEKPGHVLSRNFLLERVWGFDRDVEMTSKAVDMAVSRMRASLGAWGGLHIVAVDSYGYRLAPEEE